MEIICVPNRPGWPTVTCRFTYSLGRVSVDRMPAGQAWNTKWLQACTHLWAPAGHLSGLHTNSDTCRHRQVTCQACIQIQIPVGTGRLPVRPAYKSRLPTRRRDLGHDGVLADEVAHLSLVPALLHGPFHPFHPSYVCRGWASIQLLQNIALWPKEPPRWWCDSSRGVSEVLEQGGPCGSPGNWEPAADVDCFGTGGLRQLVHHLSFLSVLCKLR